MKQGTRFLKEYSVKNEYSEPLQLNVNQYHIDHSEINYLDSGTGNRGSCEIGKFSLGGGEAVSRVHYLDARVSEQSNTTPNRLVNGCGDPFV